MEKILWVRSDLKGFGAKDNSGLDVVNNYLAEGWKVKHVSACPVPAGSTVALAQAYIVIEKNS